MGVGLADLRGLRRAVDAVALTRQPDPHKANRIVWAWRNHERLLRAHALESIFGIVAVVRVLGHAAYLELAARCRLLGASGGDREETDQLAVLVESPQRLRGFVDLQPRRLRFPLITAALDH